jgi:hypothetical protein
VAPELASQAGQAAGGGAFFTPFGNFNSNVYSVVGNLNDLVNMGYTRGQAETITGAQPRTDQFPVQMTGA